MTTFSDIERLQPPSTIVVSPNAWSSTWAKRPKEDVCLGLRFVSDRELEDAHIEAYKRAERLFPAHKESEAAKELFAASFTGTLMRWVVARGTCDPNDVTQLWELWADAAEDIAVEMALTDHGVQFIYDAWERMRIAADIAMPVASDDDISLLSELAKRLPTLAGQSRAREQRCRRLLRFVLEELESIAPPPTTTPG